MLIMHPSVLSLIVIQGLALSISQLVKTMIVRSTNQCVSNPATSSCLTSCTAIGPVFCVGVSILDVGTREGSLCISEHIDLCLTSTNPIDIAEDHTYCENGQLQPLLPFGHVLPFLGDPAPCPS